jgi:toxin ParE1/3/4
MTIWGTHPKAEADLDDIWNYTVQKWGIWQAQSYLAQLHAAFQSLCEQPVRGRPIDEVKSGLWRYSAGAHIIVFTRNEKEVAIIRVLHERMDIPARLISV